MRVIPEHCTRCGREEPATLTETGHYVVTRHDACAICSGPLCVLCLTHGCCGHYPAVSEAEYHEALDNKRKGRIEDGD